MRINICLLLNAFTLHKTNAIEMIFSSNVHIVGSSIETDSLTERGETIRNEYLSHKELEIGFRFFVHGMTFSLQFGPACPADSVEQVDWAELGT